MNIAKSIGRSIGRSLVSQATEAAVTERYFTELAAAGNQHYDFGAPITATRMVVDVYPITNGTGLPNGAPSVAARRLQTLDFTLTDGSIQYIGRNGSNYFTGYVANVKIYNGTQLVAYLKLDGTWGSTTAPDSSGAGNDATAVNITSADATAFSVRDNGDWVADDTAPALNTFISENGTTVNYAGSTLTVNRNNSGNALLHAIGEMSGTTITGRRYEVAINITPTVGWSVTLGGATSNIYTGSGTQTIYITALVDTPFIHIGCRNSLVAEVAVTSLEVREIMQAI